MQAILAGRGVEPIDTREFGKATPGAVIAQAYFPAATMFPVMTGTLFNQFLAAVFGRVFSRAFSPDANKGNQPARDTEAPGADGAPADGSSPAHRPQGHESAA